MADNNTTPQTEASTEQTKYRVKVVNVVDGNGDIVANQVPLAPSYDNVEVTNPQGANNVYDRSLKDVLFAKFQTISATDENGDPFTYKQQTGYYDIDVDVWSVAEALAEVTNDTKRHLFGIVDEQQSGTDVTVTNSSFDDVDSATTYLEEKYNDIYTADEIALIAAAYDKMSLYQAGIEQMARFTQQIYGIPEQILFRSDNGDSCSTEYSEDVETFLRRITDNNAWDKVTISSPETPRFLGSFLNKDSIMDHWLIKEWTWTTKDTEGIEGTEVVKTLTGLHFATEDEAAAIVARMKQFSFMSTILDHDILIENMMFGEFGDGVNGDTGGAIVMGNDITKLFNKNRGITEGGTN